jgi:hypothetical protein
LQGNFGESNKTADFAGVLRDGYGCDSSIGNCKNVDPDKFGDNFVGAEMSI